MEEQDSILLQKKTILILSAIIVTLLFSLTYRTNLRAKKVATAIKEYNRNLITVERPDEYEEVISEQVVFSASTEVLENTIDEKSNSTETSEVKKLDKKDEVVTDVEKQKIEDSKIEDLKELENIEKTKAEETVKNEVKAVSYRDLAENNPPENYKSVIEATATAYCLCEKCCGKSPSSPGYGVTASGLKIVPGTGMKVIAVDPKIIPLGSKVYVEGLNGAWDYGYAVAADTGGAIKNIRVDLYMDSHSETLSWGRKKVNIYVVE